MAMATVLFEPIGEEIECAEDETVLDAAFRQGYSLVYGCREGQCSACKCYLLEGEVALKRYSTFALSESEESQGYTLLCRAMPESDLVVELLHFDPDDYRTDVVIREGRSTILAIESLTHDITRLHLKIEEPDDFDFKPGHYVDLLIPGTDEKRSFSLANLPGDGHLEFMIKRYPGGRFSGMLESELSPGDELCFTGPYGAFYLRQSERPILMVAGGSGMAPVLGVLRQLAQQESERRVRFFYGARTRSDLFHLDVINEFGERLGDFEFVPVLSDPTEECAWEGETGFVHEAVARYLDGGAMDGDLEAYMCGPPPLIDAASELLIDGHQIADTQIHYDKFTTAASADD
jgi:propane monooxygenase reductase subunit